MFRSKMNTLLIGGAAAISGVTGFSLLRDERTTNFTPSVSWDYNWDKQQPESLKLKTKSKTDSNNNASSSILNENNENDYQKPTATRHLLFIRHGKYNVSGENDEQRYLTEKGQLQAELTGKRLKSFGCTYAHFVYSTKRRAEETAKIILKQLGHVDIVEPCSLLREGAPIPPEPPIVTKRPESDVFTDGSRIEAAFRKHVHRAPASQKESSHEIFVSHANVIRYFVCRALQLPPEAWSRMSLFNGSITLLTVRPDGRVSLGFLGDSGFMPPDMLSIN